MGLYVIKAPFWSNYGAIGIVIFTVYLFIPPEHPDGILFTARFLALTGAVSQSIGIGVRAYFLQRSSSCRGGKGYILSWFCPPILFIFFFYANKLEKRAERAKKAKKAKKSEDSDQETTRGGDSKVLKVEMSKSSETAQICIN